MATQQSAGLWSHFKKASERQVFTHAHANAHAHVRGHASESGHV